MKLQNEIRLDALEIVLTAFLVYSLGLTPLAWEFVGERQGPFMAPAITVAGLVIVAAGLSIDLVAAVTIDTSLARRPEGVAATRCE